MLLIPFLKALYFNIYGNLFIYVPNKFISAKTGVYTLYNLLIYNTFKTI